MLSFFPNITYMVSVILIYNVLTKKSIFLESIMVVLRHDKGGT